MKKILLSGLMLASLAASAQTDSTKIKALQLQTRIIEYLASNLLDPGNDSLYQVYIDLRSKFRVQNPPSGNTLVTIDSIPTVELAKLYGFTLNAPDGMGASALMKAQIATARAGNTFLDRLCSMYEDFWAQNLISLRVAGRKILRGK